MSECCYMFVDRQYGKRGLADTSGGEEDFERRPVQRFWGVPPLHQSQHYVCIQTYQKIWLFPAGNIYREFVRGESFCSLALAIECFLGEVLPIFSLTCNWYVMLWRDPNIPSKWLVLCCVFSMSSLPPIYLMVILLTMWHVCVCVRCGISMYYMYDVACLYIWICRVL